MTQKNRPNLVLVFADQMRGMDMGCAGNGYVRTPNLDNLAAEGAMFTDAVSSSAVCVPHRASMLTGLYPLSNTVFTNNIRLPDDIPSMGHMLKQQGYSTSYIGKWHLAGEPALEGYVPPGPMRHGFDHWAVHNCSHKYQDSIYYEDSSEPVVMEGWQPDGQTDLAVAKIREYARKTRAGCEPFAIVLSWGPPHTPFVCPAEYSDLYNPDKIPLRPNVADFGACLDVLDSPVPGGLTAEDPMKIIRVFMSNYYGAITNLDWNFGRIKRVLASEGIEENTLLVFTSDHGETLGSHGQFHKWQPWDESVRVPFIVSLPGVVDPGTRSAAPFGTADILPTVFGLMGIDAPPAVEGRDLSHLLRQGGGGREPISAFLLCVCAATTWGGRWRDVRRGMPRGFFRPYRGVRTREHTYVCDRRGPWMLYNNAKDPLQLDNLLESRGAKAVPAELEEELQSWLEYTDDFFGANEDYQKLVDTSSGLVVNRSGLKMSSKS